MTNEITVNLDNDDIKRIHITIDNCEYRITKSDIDNSLNISKHHKNELSSTIIMFPKYANVIGIK